MAEKDVHAAFAPFIAAKAELDKKIKDEGEKALTAFFKEYFEKSPNVYGVRWLQYVPYFNDGDACVFQLGCIGVYPTQEEFDAKANIYDFETYGEEPESTLSQIEDILKSVFGEHAKVAVTRTSIESEEYIDHD